MKRFLLQYVGRYIFICLIALGGLSHFACSFDKTQANISSIENKTPDASALSLDEDKQRGAHVFGIMDSTKNFELVTRNNIEWITMIGWGYQDDFDSARLTHHNGDSVYIVKSDAGYVHRIKLLRERGFKVFFKPHVWVTKPSEGKWRSDIFPTSDANWEQWKSNYRDFIFRYATVAEDGGAEMFCMGVEFTRLALEKPEFWRELIADLRKIYSGKITYAANWYKEYEKVTFWQDLDYIGIQAYFPLAKNEYPTTEQISKGWNKFLPDLASVSKKNNRKILFTEMGYKSIADSAIKPWEWIEKIDREARAYSEETQANCYEAFFNTVWEQDWFGGVHIWQMRNDWRGKNDGYGNMDFTPLGKLAEGVIAKGFGKGGSE